MKILHTVENYDPDICGMAEVVKQISERLVKLGHKVTVATSKNPKRKCKIIGGVNIVEFDIKGNLVRGFEGEVDKYKNFLINSRFDIITNFAAQQWATDLMLPLLDKIKVKKVNVPTGFSGLYRSEYKEYFENMKIWMKKYDLNIFLSDNYCDIDFARENKIRNNILIPNGASTEEFLGIDKIDIKTKLNIPKNNFLILLVGSHTSLKGHKEAIKIFRNANIRNATLLIVGYEPKAKNKNNIIWLLRKVLFLLLGIYGKCIEKCRRSALFFNNSPSRWWDNKKIIIKSLQREQTISAYKQADLFLFPSNVECSPIVLFECMASKTPFLVTDVGNSKEINKWSNSGILLPTKKDGNGYSHAQINESSKILEKIFYNRERRKIMAEAGFRAWKKRFTWGKIAERYEQAYGRLLRI